MDYELEIAVLNEKMEKLQSDYKELAEICRRLNEENQSLRSGRTFESLERELKGVGVAIHKWYLKQGDGYIEGYFITREEDVVAHHIFGSPLGDGYNDFMSTVFIEAEDFTELLDNLDGLMEDYVNDLNDGYSENMYPHNVDSVLDRVSELYTR